MVRSVRQRVIVAAICAVFCINVASAATTLDKQREQYKAINQAFDKKNSEQIKSLMPTLKTYPLYPYIEYRYLTENIATIKEKEIQQFIKNYPTLPLASNLSNQFSDELIKRQDWSGYVKFVVKPPYSVAGQCTYYYAQWLEGNKKVALDGATDLWLTGSDQPSACDKLFEFWRKEGRQTDNLTLKRIQLTFEKGNTKLAKVLIAQLPANYKTMKGALTELANDPTKLASFVNRVAPTHFTRSVAISTFPRLVRANINQAQSLLPTLVRWQKLKPEEQSALEQTIAWQLFGSEVSEKQAALRDQYIASSHNTNLIERRLRLALNQDDDKALAYWLDRLPDGAKQKEVWQYWQADRLLSDGKSKEGQAILTALANKRGFYAMLSAQRLGIPYVIKATQAVRPDKNMDKDPTIARIKELLYWDRYTQAGVEWRSFVASQNSEKQQALARYAFEQQWGEFSVQATIVGRLWDHLEERFPVAYHDIFSRAVDNKAISKYYAMAIARQESGLNPNVSSPVGARGLMQLMPATAKDAAKMVNMVEYKQASQLFDPEINIYLGSAYLDYVFQRFDKNRVLATAAYNAGPTRVERWLKAGQGKLNAAAFIESIPYNETRSYVQNVLTYDVFYAYFLGEKSVKLLTDEEWSRKY